MAKRIVLPAEARLTVARRACSSIRSERRPALPIRWQAMHVPFPASKCLRPSSTLPFVPAFSASAGSSRFFDSVKSFALRNAGSTMFSKMSVGLSANAFR